MPASEPRKLGKYEVLEVVGRGGMGVVYKAVDPEIGRSVGIKVMTSAVMNDPQLLKRFYREAQSAGKLHHPNIVTIYDLGVHEGTPYIVMEFLEGESLDTALRTGRLRSLEEKLNVVVQVCNALAYAHEQSIIHRDVKPGNVMSLKDGTVKLVDFGIARVGKEYLTGAGQLMGSVHYMSPEQIQGTPVDSRSDIFSTGVLLYQMLTGTLPFEAKDPGATLLKIIHDAPAPISQFLQDYPPELDGIVQRVLAKSPDDRYQTASDLAFDLSQVEERLKRERLAEELKVAELSITEQRWDKAREQLLQLLKVDRQNTRANMLLRDIQQQIQKQERFQRIRDLQKQAEEATTRNAPDEALHYLDIAVGLDSSNAQLRELRDSMRARKKRSEQIAELLARAKSAFDTQDFEDALASAQQALSVDAENADAKELHAAISHELLERTKLKRIQAFVDEARKQISSRRFTAALNILREAEAIDPNGPGLNELRALVSSGQQQERRRKELEQLTGEIEEALNCNDHAAACSKAVEALEKFPNDRGLMKLKALAQRERENAEKRTYVESQVSHARRLLEEKKSNEALVPLQEALARYPDEFILQSMYSLITEYIERDRAEQFRARIIQQAKECIRRKAYAEAIDILKAAQQQSSSEEFEDLLQFTEDEAATYALRQKVDATAEKSHQLISADKYDEAILVLESTLREVDDPELRIMLEDARRHVAQWNADLEEAMATARRLVTLQRYAEAIKFLEINASRFGTAQEFAALTAQVQREQLRTQKFSTAKEQSREALAVPDFTLARSLWQKYRDEFGDDVDSQLLLREIDAKEAECAVASVAQALRDCRILLTVGCFEAALDILERVSAAAALVPADVKREYESARATALAGVQRERFASERYKQMQQELARDPNKPTLNDSEFATAVAVELGTGPEQGTQVAKLSDLEKVLGEVTLIAKHYAGDQKIQSAVGMVRQQLTIQIAALRHADTSPNLDTQRLLETQRRMKPVQAPDQASRTPTPVRKIPEPEPVQPLANDKTVVYSEGSTQQREAWVGGDRTVIDSPQFREETERFSLQNTSVESPEEITATALIYDDVQRSAAARRQTGKRLPAPKRTKNVLVLLAGVVLLALILYMAWRLTHQATGRAIAPAHQGLPTQAVTWLFAGSQW